MIATKTPKVDCVFQSAGIVRSHAQRLFAPRALSARLADHPSRGAGGRDRRRGAFRGLCHPTQASFAKHGNRAWGRRRQDGDVAKFTLYVVDYNEEKFRVIGEEFGRVWDDPKPAWTLVPVPALALAGAAKSGPGLALRLSV